LPGDPARRPCIESSEKIELRSLRSAAVISGVVPPVGVAVVAGGDPPPQAVTRTKTSEYVPVRIRRAAGLRKG
jgi:hypothetical protein